MEKARFDKAILIDTRSLAGEAFFKHCRKVLKVDNGIDEEDLRKFVYDIYHDLLQTYQVDTILVYEGRWREVDEEEFYEFVMRNIDWV